MADFTGIGNYFEILENEFKNSPEEGYVYTLTFDSDSSINAFGLAKVTAHLKLSCSHTGKTLCGAWGGEMSFDYKAEYGGIKLLLAAIGGGLSATEGASFKNDRFLMRLKEYESDYEDIFRSLLQAPDRTEGSQAVSDVFNGILNAVNGIEDKEFEKTEPSGFWCDVDFRKTEGDMSAYAKLFAYAGLAKAESEASDDNKEVQAKARAVVPITGQIITKNIADEIVDPFPYIIKVYPDGNAVFSLFAPNGGATMKWYGTWDKIPVDKTVKAE